MRIAEIFYSIQGEGSLVGVPSVFVRTSGCNLRCAWCDTPYTSWQPEGDDWTLDAIFAEVGTYPARARGGHGRRAHDRARDRGADARLHARGLHITIETAGTVYRAGRVRLDEHQPEAGQFHARRRLGGAPRAPARFRLTCCGG